MDNSILKNIYTYFLDTIFPIYCLECNVEGDWICKTCLNKIEISLDSNCPRCHKKTNLANYCKECQHTSKMAGILIASSYENKILQKSIRYFKYKYIKDINHFLGSLLLKRLKNWKEINPKDYVLIPVPLHKKKFKKRGFNQSTLICEDLSKKTKISLEKNILQRIKNTPAQAKLSPLQRRKNIKNAFKIDSSLPKNYLLNKNVFLIDDVCTTSSTLEECAKEISKLKPNKIWGLVLARGK